MGCLNRSFGTVYDIDSVLTHILVFTGQVERYCVSYNMWMTAGLHHAMPISHMQVASSVVD